MHIHFMIIIQHIKKSKKKNQKNILKDCFLFFEQKSVLFQ